MHPIKRKIVGSGLLPIPSQFVKELGLERHVDMWKEGEKVFIAKGTSSYLSARNEVYLKKQFRDQFCEYVDLYIEDGKIVVEEEKYE